MSGVSEKIGSVSEEKKRSGSLSLSRGNSLRSNGGERPSSRASSSTSSRLTREEVSSIYSYNGGEEEEEREEALEDFCRNIFDICDTDNDGFITINELLCHCDDTFLMNTLIEALGTDQDSGGRGSDGKLSFEEFRVGLERVSELLLRDELDQSTPERNKKDNSSGSTVVSDNYINGTVLVYESDGVTNEEAWLKAMSRIDPHEHLSKNEELKTMWTELSSQDPSLLDRFEGFLSMVVTDLEKSQTEVETIQSKIRKLLTDQSREAHEMDDILQEQLMEARDKQEKKSQEVSDRISTHYQELLEEREALIVKLSEKEQTLRTFLEEKTLAELELRKEKQELITLNQTLKDQLSDSYRQLSASQRQLQLIAGAHPSNEREQQLQWLPGEDPLVETSITTTESFIMRGSTSPSLSPRGSISPSLHYNSSCLAVEVEQAMRNISPTHEATPIETTPTPVPTPEEERVGLLAHYNEEEELKGRANDSNSSIVYNTVSKVHESVPVTPVHFNDTSSGFTLSQLIPPREERPHPPQAVSNRYDANATPSRVFKVVILGDSGVGKTSIIRRLSSPTSEPLPAPRSTLGLDYSTALINAQDETVVFQLWDTAGQERFHSTTAVYFKRADAFIIVYDVTSKNTFESVKAWINLVKATIRTELPVLMLMGNKCDCRELRQVKKEEGQKLAFELRALFSETSAKSGDNVLQSHTTLASLLLERENQDMEAIRRSALRLDKNEQRRKCKC
ncbi:PREDICTED: ras and EF-hand domain-containing protein homolog [Amphimedon queenslandica]|uniref:EF-hand domain-containing protein n=1 Tax=Amphimedon queenslandica TaxID=400682 RepID=A0A1X7V0Z6_AMPQE|nr:PREDICTED: ras and EF-hand domain-containing protein homolog [Amphimedon queenslandica]|eukprot:XP_011403598.1 PREDICTED: ras and EF-hand domain-containing protein homolog [Amphimedon queenslandica]